MTLFFALFAYILFFIFAILIDNQDRRTRTYFLMLTCVVLTIMVGTRNPYVWNDTLAYLTTFNKTHGLFSLTPDDHPYGYTEMGFFYLTAFVKTFTNSPTLFLTVISALTFFFLYKSFNKYSIYPMFAVAVYLARFYTGRNMVQIRAGLAVAIVVYFTFFVLQKKRWQYLLVIFITYHLHNSAIVALPLLLLGNYRIKSKYIYIGIIVSLIIGGVYGGTVRTFVQNNEFLSNMGGTYVAEGTGKSFSNDLTNPVIWYQIFVLFAFTFYEKRLSKLTPYYHIMRNGYFYCTCILIIMCRFAVVAARTSTVFATFEIAMVPLLVQIWGKKNKYGLYALLAIPYVILFALNWSPHYK